MVFKTGSIMAIVGGVIMLIVGLVELDMLLYEFYFSVLIDLGYKIALFINIIMTLMWGAIAIFISVSKLRGQIIEDNYLLLLGIGGLIAMFIPIYFSTSGYYFYIRLISTYYIDIGLILTGGILDIAMTGVDQKEFIHRKKIYSNKYEENQ